ncbi:MAG TPA: hypothetical protein VGU72_22825 [Beijerinckiaceae bacterium]|jgi:hypothetical protein|nr:hypothetical protein [Beijerinckiaceae bacterium]
MSLVRKFLGNGSKQRQHAIWLTCLLAAASVAMAGLFAFKAREHVLNFGDASDWDYLFRLGNYAIWAIGTALITLAMALILRIAR